MLGPARGADVELDRADVVQQQSHQERLAKVAKHTGALGQRADVFLRRVPGQDHEVPELRIGFLAQVIQQPVDAAPGHVHGRDRCNRDFVTQDFQTLDAAGQLDKRSEPLLIQLLFGVDLVIFYFTRLLGCMKNTFGRHSEMKRRSGVIRVR